MGIRPTVALWHTARTGAFGHNRTVAVTFRFFDLVKIERQVFGDLISDSVFRSRPGAVR